MKNLGFGFLLMLAALAYLLDRAPQPAPSRSDVVLSQIEEDGTPAIFRP